MTSKRVYNVVLMGATGYTGELAFEYLARTYFGPSARDKISFAVAGRNQAKLEAARSRIASKLGNADVESIPIIACDSHDDAALDEMTKATTCVMSTVGPYLKHGTPLVKACATNGTSYCDITGESMWMRLVEQEFGDLARKNKCRIISLCGFDCIPSDIGCYLAAKHMKKNLSTVPERINGYVVKLKGGVSGGTIASLMDTMASPDLAKQAKELGSPYELIPADKRPAHRQPDASSVSYEEDVKRMTTLWVMSAINTKSVMKTAYLHPELYSENFEYREKSCLPTKGWSGWFQGQSVRLGVGLVFASAYFSLTRPILRFLAPKPGTGPSEHDLENGKLRMEFYAYKKDDAPNQPSVKSTVVMHRDPGYGETAKMITECAITLALHGDELPSDYGFLTPVAAMGDFLVDRLIAAGIDLSAETVGPSESPRESREASTDANTPPSRL